MFFITTKNTQYHVVNEGRRITSSVQVSEERVRLRLPGNLTGALMCIQDPQGWYMLTKRGHRNSILHVLL